MHSTHWFYSIEIFLNRVDRTYSGVSADVSSSWICSLYAIFALGSSSYSGNRNQYESGGASLIRRDEKSSIDYITMAKQLIPALYDEADIDSIRALSILVCGPVTKKRLNLLNCIRALQWKTSARGSAPNSTWARVSRWHIRLGCIATNFPTPAPLWNENNIVGSGGRCSRWSKK